MSRQSSPIEVTDGVASTSKQDSPFVHPDRQMSIVNTAGDIEKSSPAMAVDSREDKPSGGEPAPKRQRTLNTEDKKRGQRLFGNLLGQLGKFTKEEKTKAASERAKARQEVADRVASKLQGESKRVQDINGLERELRSARNEQDRLHAVLREAEMTFEARSRQLPFVSRYLLTGSAWTSNSTGARALLMSIGPAQDARRAAESKPLYYLPKKLLPEEEDILDQQEDEAADLIKKEKARLEALRIETSESLNSWKDKRLAAQEKLDGYKETETEGQVETSAQSMDIDSGRGEQVEEVSEPKTGTEDKAVQEEIKTVDRTDAEGDEVEY